MKKKSLLILLLLVLIIGVTGCGNSDKLSEIVEKINNCEIIEI